MAKGKPAHRPGTPAKGNAARPAAAGSVRTATQGNSKTPTSASSSATSPARSAKPLPAAERPAAERKLGSATGGMRSAGGASSPAARTRPGAGNARRRAKAVPWWRRGKTPFIGTGIIVLLLVALFVYIAQSQSPDIGASPASPAVVNQVTHVSPQVFSAVGTGNVPNQLKVISGAELLKGPNGKPEVLYIGAGYCPYCAAQRWSMIVALSRFGTFKGLQFTHSSTTDVYPNTSTFTFYGSTYTSQYIDFVPVEETGQDQSTALQSPTDAEQQILQTYDTSQYVGNLANGIPFVDYGNHFVQVSSPFSPQLLAGQSWQQIADALSNPSSSVTQNIVGNANYMTAAICTLTNDQPASVCSSGPIPTIEQQIQKGL